MVAFLAPPFRFVNPMGYLALGSKTSLDFPFSNSNSGESPAITKASSSGDSSFPTTFFQILNLGYPGNTKYPPQS